MGNLPASTSKTFNPADYKSAPDWFTGRFLSNLNLFTQPVYTSLLNGLTFQQNFNAQFYTTSVQGAATYTGNAISFQSSIQGSPVAVQIVAKNVAGNLTTPLISPIDFSWYFNSPTIFITGISGLQPGIFYSLTFMVF